jgi:hypothetical protein
MRPLVAQSQQADDPMRALLLGLAFLAAPAWSDPIRPTLELTSVRIEVTWVHSASELARLRQQYERPVGDSRSRVGIGGGLDRLGGFSVLGKRNGEHVCLVYIYRPAFLDDDRTRTLGHEMLHCLLGEYHE